MVYSNNMFWLYAIMGENLDQLGGHNRQEQGSLNLPKASDATSTSRGMSELRFSKSVFLTLLYLDSIRITNILHNPVNCNCIPSFSTIKCTMSLRNISCTHMYLFRCCHRQ